MYWKNLSVKLFRLTPSAVHFREVFVLFQPIWVAFSEADAEANLILHLPRENGSLTTAMASTKQDVWHYVYEALQNVRCLQLLLFHRALSPDHDCVNFTAVVVRRGSLRCAWDSPTGTSHSLEVSLPACLLDLSLPVHCWTRHDHVEIRLGLLSLDPVLYALQLSLEDESVDVNVVQKDETKPFSLDFDAQALESGDGVQFFCRTCSCQLTNAPFRRVIEVPSLDWREVSEHFYGNCCSASFGVQAALLAARFQQLLTSSEGTCLVASTTCIVHKGDVITPEGDRDEPAAANLLHSDKIDSDPCVGHIEVETSHLHISDHEDSKQNSGESSRNKSCARDSNGSEHCSTNLEVNSGHENKLHHYQNGGNGRTTAEEIQEGYVFGNIASPEGFESTCHENTVEEPCCSSDCSSRKSASTELSSLLEGKYESPESLGNGFMAGSQSEVLDWEPFYCRTCSSLVGARRGDSSKNGLQFFKCQISTQKSIASSSNLFREHSLERLFTHELAKDTESNSSYRYVVRSFQTGAALLQLVLLNQSALVISGTCPPTSTPNSGDTALESGCQAEHAELHETHDRKPGNVSLKTVAKFMFCDCRILGLEELRLIDKWAQLQKADDIFVLDEVAGTLIDLLKSHQLAYPPSCQSFQQFSLSFLSK